MTSDLTPEDLAAIDAAEAGEAVDLDAPSRAGRVAPTVRVWPSNEAEAVLHAAGLAVYLAARAIAAEAEEP